MTRKKMLLLAIAMAFAMPTQLHAASIATQFRAGVITGPVGIDVKVSVPGDEGRFDDSGLSLGLITGASMSLGDFYGDLGLEWSRTDFGKDDFGQETKARHQTVVSLLGGYFLNETWSLFAGIRLDQQGGNFFDDQAQDGEGFFLGAAAGGIKTGPVRLSSSLAYNLQKAKNIIPGSDTDYPGFSLKLSGSLERMPQHQLQFRLQRFSGDESGTLQVDNGDGTFTSVPFTIELEENYAQLFYLYSFGM